MRDEFVTGLINDVIEDRWCKEEIEKSLDEMVELALNREVTVKTINMIAEILKLKKDFKRTGSYKQKSRRYVCNNNDESRKQPATPKDKINQSKLTNTKPVGFHCGKKVHDFPVCKYKHYKCKVFAKKSHLAAVCKK